MIGTTVRGAGAHVPVLTAAELGAIRYAQRVVREMGTQLRTFDRIGRTQPPVAFGSRMLQVTAAAGIGTSLPAWIDQLGRSVSRIETSVRHGRHRAVADAIRRGATGPVNRALARRVARAVLRPRKGPVVLDRTSVRTRRADDPTGICRAPGVLSGAATPCAPPAAA